MQTGNYIVTAAAIDIWLPPHRKRKMCVFCLSLGSYMLDINDF